MAVQIIFFVLSLIIFCVFIYIIASLWFRGKRNRKLKLFSAFGVLCSFWVLMNGVNVLLGEELHAVIYPFMPQSIVCVFPMVFLLYILEFAESKHADSPLIFRALAVFSFLDLLIVLTNPLHKEFISGFDGLAPRTGKLFLFHALLSYIPIAIAVVVLYGHIIKNFKKKPMLGFIGAAFFIPFALNILYSFQIFDFEFDLAPFGFIFLYGAYAAYSISVRQFDIKETEADEIFKSLSEALIVVDRAGFVANANPAFLRAFPDVRIVFDKTPVSEVADYLRSISAGEDSPEVYEKLFSNEPEDIGGAEITVMNGELRNYSLSKDIISEGKYYLGYIVTLAEISHYRRMIDKISELKTRADTASSAKGLFLSNMSHEIRTPLNAIIGMINIGKNTGDVQKKDYCFARADSASKHLLGLINDILDISKIEADKFELSYGDFDLGKTLENIINVANIKAEEKSQTLAVNFNRGVPARIGGDELRLSQVITNLLTNAIKFTPERGEVKLDVSAQDETETETALRFTITDTGIGISDDQQKKLFSSFTQADAGITSRYGGTGLGLAISKRIVELMGGVIWVESELGKGSKFIFTIKARHALSPSEEVTLTEETGDEPGRYDFNSYRVLIAEDIEINREIMSAILEETGVTIEYAENGRIAVEMYRKNPEKYGLILMDVNMPEMDGYEATRAIRNTDTERASSIPIIAMTANVFKEDIERCLESGMNDHTGKPVDANALFGLMRNYLTRDEKRRMKNVHELDYGVAWDENLLTGNAIVDMQHQKIFERLSDLVDSCETGSDTEKLYDTFMFLINRTIRHFTDEEALQLEYGYPDYENHRKKHEAFKAEVNELARRFEENGSTGLLSGELNKTIVKWMVNHIKQEDVKLSGHIRNLRAARADAAIT